MAYFPLVNSIKYKFSVENTTLAWFGLDLSWLAERGGMVQESNREYREGDQHLTRLDSVLDTFIYIIYSCNH